MGEGNIWKPGARNRRVVFQVARAVFNAAAHDQLIACNPYVGREVAAVLSPEGHCPEWCRRPRWWRTSTGVTATS